MKDFLSAITVHALFLHPVARPAESPHRTGPAGLQGWTLTSTIPDHGKQQFAYVLVIARNGHIVRRIHSNSLLWTWTFLPDGRHVAYEDGPLHSGMSCVLLDIDSGKELASYDCFRDPLPADAPNWVKKLEMLSGGH